LILDVLSYLVLEVYLVFLFSFHVGLHFFNFSFFSLFLHFLAFQIAF